MGVRREIDRLEGKMNPAPEQPNPTVTRTLEQVVAQEFPNECEHGRIGGRVKAVASVIDHQASHFEAACISSNTIGLFDNGHVMAAACQPQGSTQTSRTCSEDYNT
jgi:hypothetical protein